MDPTSASISRVERIKGVSIQRQILNDITASEFALRVELKTEEKKIDYEMLISKLDKDLENLKKKELAIIDRETLIDRIIQTKNDLISAREGLKPKYLLSSSPQEKEGSISELQR